MESRIGDELRDYLRFATTKVPYYARRRDQYDPSRLTESSLDRLPILSKQEVRSAFPSELVPIDLDVPGGLRAGRLEMLTSSGTSGGPVTVIADAGLAAFPKDYGACWGLAPDHPPLRTAVLTSPACSGTRCSTAFSDRTSAGGTTLTLATPRNLFAAEDQSFEEMADELRRFGPNLIFANPVYLLAFARRISALGLDVPHVSAILCSYQLAARSQIRALEALFGVPVLSTYGASELGGCQIGFECSHRRMHVFEPHCLIEVVDPVRRFGDGEVGRVVVTTLGGFVSALIRYDIGDLAEITHPNCECPLAGSPVLELHGRAADALEVGGRTITSLDVDDVMSRIDGIDFYRCTQSAPRVFAVDAIPAPDRAPTSGEIRDALGAAFDVEVEVRLTDYLAPERSLKFSLTRSRTRQEIFVMTKTNEVYEHLMDVFRKEGHGGGYFYSDQEVRSYLAWIVLTRGVPLDGLSPEIQRVVAETLIEAAVDPSMAGPQLAAAVLSYYRAHPVNPDLDRDFSTALCSVMGWGRDENAVQTALGNFLGRPAVPLAPASTASSAGGVRLSDLAPRRRINVR